MTASINDFAQFAELRRGADRQDPAALREVAGQFEALFLQSMLKSMREATPGDPLFGDNDAQEMYETMLDQQLALEMASGKGIGIAELLVRQLGGADSAVGEESTGIRDPGAARPSPAWSDPDSFARDVWPHAKRTAQRLGVAHVLTQTCRNYEICTIRPRNWD